MDPIDKPKQFLTSLRNYFKNLKFNLFYDRRMTLPKGCQNSRKIFTFYNFEVKPRDETPRGRGAGARSLPASRQPERLPIRAPCSPHTLNTRSRRLRTCVSENERDWTGAQTGQVSSLPHSPAEEDAPGTWGTFASAVRPLPAQGDADRWTPLRGASFKQKCQGPKGHCGRVL